MSLRVGIPEIKKLVEATTAMRGKSPDAMMKLRVHFMSHMDVSEDVPDDVLKIASTVATLFPISEGMTEKEWGSSIKGVILGAWIAGQLHAQRIVIA